MAEAPVTSENPIVEEPSNQEHAPITPEVGKSGTASVWVNLDKLKLFKAAVKLQRTTSLSDELNQFFDRRTQEIKGIRPNSDLTTAEAQAARLQAYETAKRRVFEMHTDLLKMVRFFKEQHCWDSYIEAFVKYVDYDGRFDRPEASYGYGRESREKAFDAYCIRFIEVASDREVDFKRETARFLLRNKGVELVYSWISFVEKLRDKRKLSKQMLQYQVDALGPEQLTLLQQEETQRQETQQLKEEARLKAEREESEKRKQEHEGRLKEETEEDWNDEEDNKEESEEEGSDVDEDADLDKPTAPVPIEDENKHPEECHAIVLVGETK